MDKQIKIGMAINDIAKTHRGMGAGVTMRRTLECIALIAADVGEAANECRGDVPTHLLGRKLAGIILGAMDLAQQEGIDIDYEIVSKMISNHASGNLKNR